MERPNLRNKLAVATGVTGVLCGAFAKELLRNMDGTSTVRTEELWRATPKCCLGETDDLIATLLNLTDDTLSALVTGIVIPVDGGFAAYSGV